MPIRVLDPTVAAQIAAGEVVERPASVVKELVENALDAGATRVSVGVRGGGIEELVIQDNGRGIPADEIEIAFARHATSKLTSADDLWAIATLGFRGEALPSIAAVAQVICQSRIADAATGAELRVAGGETQHLAPRGGAPGTTFTIRNLFYNVPVRREFLKSPAAEAAAIASVVTQYALAYPHVAFTLARDGKRVFQTSGRGQLADVILELYGVDVARQMIPVEGRAGEDIGEVRVSGMVSAPSVTRSSRDGMHITVNGRAIAPRGQVGAIVEEAYHTLVMKGRFPIVVLHLQVHPAAVDVNVHPTKSEVKFRNPALVARTLGRVVREAVQSAVVVQGWRDPALAGEPDAPDHAGSAAPARESAGESRPIAEEARPIAEEARPTIDEVRSPAALFPRGASEEPGERFVGERGAPATPDPAPIDRSPIQARLIDPEAGSQVARSFDLPEVQEYPSGRIPERALDERESAPDWRRADLSPRVREEPLPYSPRDARAPEPAPAESRPYAPAPAPQAPRLPSLRALAQLGQTYLLTEGPDGALFLVDQHAAHERITYERLLAQHAAGAVQSQALLMPQPVELPPDARQTLLGAQDELASWGFALEDAEAGVLVGAVPAGLALEDLTPTLADLASHLAGGGANPVAEGQDALLATLACHTSVRAGQSLTLMEQQALLDQLGGCEGPRTCPHGRPTLIVITRHQLERQFGRLGA